jgi:hypothetical protein
MKRIMIMSVGEMPYAGFKYFKHGTRLYKIKECTVDCVLAEPVEADSFDIILKKETEVEVYRN